MTTRLHRARPVFRKKMEGRYAPCRHYATQRARHAQKKLVWDCVLRCIGKSPGGSPSALREGGLSLAWSGFWVGWRAVGIGV